jgi:hypothetical protein
MLPSAPAQPPADIRVTRDSRGLPIGCGPSDVANLVTRFFDAFNRRDWAAIDARFARAGSEPPDFQLFGLDRDVVYERERLLPYLAGVRSRGEQFRLVAISVEPSRPGSVAASYAYGRSAGMALGKALIDCASQRIWQGAMGAPGSTSPRMPCPRPPGWSPNGSVVACADGANAPALADAFRVMPRSTKFSGRCRPQAVAAGLRRMLTAFNAGDGDMFSRELTRRAAFQPLAGALRQRRAMVRYVSGRYHAGEGWSATQLVRLRVAGARSVLYRLSLDVVHQTRLFSRGHVLVTIDCPSGLVARWLGPGVRTPT